MVNNHGDWLVSPLNGVMGPLINGRKKWLINGGDPNYLLTGMTLQVWMNLRATALWEALTT